MENQDNLFNQIKTAAQNAEAKDFPSMDKVWNRVEDKLDQKVLKKENTLWKKVAVAASILLVFSVAYHYFSTKESVIIQPKNQIVISDTTDTITKQKAIDSSKNHNPLLKENTDKILQDQLKKQHQIVLEEDSKIKSDATSNEPAPIPPTSVEEKVTSSKNSNEWMADRKFKSRGVTYTEIEKSEKEKVVEQEKQKIVKKAEPLIIVDGKISNVDITEFDEEQYDSIIDLKEPLYIINGVHYTELELFGPNPTSPYAPIQKQKIETYTILLPEKAAAIYGEKGKKGVVIITTKNGKPATKKGK